MAGGPRAAILVTGNEVLRGVIQERDAGILARSLDGRGVALDRVLVVGDSRAGLRAALAELLGSGVDLVVTTGGLGPTHDDLTMEMVAEATGRAMALDPEALALVLARSAGLRGRVRATDETRRAVAEKQATLPVGARVLPPVGTAAGALVAHDGCLVVVLPGPPWELEEMWEGALETPELGALLARVGASERRVLRLFGVIESEFVQTMADLGPEVRAGAEIGVCAKGVELEVTIRARRADGVAAVERGLEAAYGAAVYSRDGRTVDAVVAGALRARAESLAVAESCTGGLLGARLTAAAGASDWFRGGVIAYDDAVKRDLLGVPRDLLQRHGAVSAECARAMAEGARGAADADWALSVTGVAGPGGGTARKPVGLVYIGVAGPSGSAAHEHHFRGDRERVRERSVAAALHRLRLALDAEAPRAQAATG